MSGNCLLVEGFILGQGEPSAHFGRRKHVEDSKPKRIPRDVVNGLTWRYPLQKNVGDEQHIDDEDYPFGIDCKGSKWKNLL